MKLFTRNEYLAYVLPDDWPRDRLVVDPALEHTRASRESVLRFLADDKSRRKTFGDHLDRGYVGQFLHYGDQWVNYVWMSTPDTPPPLHVPRHFGGLSAFWLFYGHTRANCRGQKLHEIALRHLCCDVREANDKANVIADCEADNIPTRKILLRMGFVEKGIIGTMGVPRLRLLRGGWHRDLGHPPMAQLVTKPDM